MDAYHPKVRELRDYYHAASDWNEMDAVDLTGFSGTDSDGPESRERG